MRSQFCVWENHFNEERKQKNNDETSNPLHCVWDRRKTAESWAQNNKRRVDLNFI